MKKKDQKTGYELTLIGHSGSGKTTLAVGLYATSTEDFTVSSATKETRSYIERLKAGIESGIWPDATNEAELLDIRFNIHRAGGETANLAFKGYMGERADLPGYKAEIVKNPDGAIILLNPGMPILRDPVERNKMIGNIKDIISYLSEPGRRCKAIAFVVTASDRLKTDLKDFAADFQVYEAVIVNFLKTSAFHERWRKFEVTVSGELQSQTKPHFAPGAGNTASEPFRWLFDTIAGLNRRRNRKGVFRSLGSAAAACIAIAALAGGGMYWKDGSAVAKAQRDFTRLSQEMDKAVNDGKWLDVNAKCNGLEDLQKEMAELRPRIPGNQRRCKAIADAIPRRVEYGRLAWFPNEIERLEKSTEILGKPGEPLTKRQYDDKIEAWKSLDTAFARLITFSGESTNKLQRLRTEWEESKNEMRGRLEGFRLAGFRPRVDNEAAAVDQLLLARGVEIDGKPRKAFWDELNQEFDAFHLETEDARTKLGELRQECNAKKTNLFAKIDAHNERILREQFSAYDAEAAKKASEETCKSWRGVIVSWEPLATEGIDRQKKMLAEFDEKRIPWQQAYESKRYSEGVQKLLQDFDVATRNLSDGTQLHEALVASRPYQSAVEKDDDRFIAKAIRLDAWQKIQEARNRALDALFNNQIARWDPRGRKEPEHSKEDLNILDSILKDDDALSKEDYDKWMAELSERLMEAKAKWNENQRSICENFIKKIEKIKDAYFALNEFDGFYSDNAKNPYITNVINRVKSELDAGFDKLIREATSWDANLEYKAQIKKAEKAFNSVRELCNKLLKTRCEDLKADRWFTFAEKCVFSGKINDGFYECFPQTVTITRVHVMLDYTPQPDAWTRKDGFPVKFEKVSLDVLGKCLQWDDKTDDFKSRQRVDIGPCMDLKEEANRSWRQVWTGSKTLESNPWRRVVLALTATDRNKSSLSPDKPMSTSLLIQDKLQFERSRGYLEQTIEMNTQRNTGDQNPKVHFRIYGKVSGDDFWSFHPEMQKGSSR